MPLFESFEEAVCIKELRADGERGVVSAATGTTGWGGMGACSAVKEDVYFICRTGRYRLFRIQRAMPEPRGGAKRCHLRRWAVTIGW